jgi:hypothetical protein
VFTRTDAGTATENVLAISRNSSAEVTLFAVTADNITLNGVDATDFARLSQANEFLAIQKITAAAAVQRFRESGAASDEKEWFIGGLNSGRFRMGTESDAVSGGNDFLAVDRTGTTVDSVALTATAITLNGKDLGAAVTTGAQTATFSATNKPGAGTAGPTTWLPITVSGTTYYIPCFGAG